MTSIIGVDLDNTIISYDDVMHSLAVERGLISPDVKKSKKQIRDTIRQLAGGEIEWQKLQAVVYGSEMRKARLIDGVWRFFNTCRQRNITVYIVSCKTEYAKFDHTKTNLRKAALDWMKENKFFNVDGLHLPRKHVYFETTKRKKSERIRQLGCTHFIDDLEEMFREDTFPAHVQKILYAPNGTNSSLSEVTVIKFKTWKEIQNYFFPVCKK